MSNKFYFLIGLICTYIAIVLAMALIYNLSVVDTKEPKPIQDESSFFENGDLR